jgi:hypothetical protein
MRISIIILFFITNLITYSYSQNKENFEGIITYKKETMFDTVFYNYYIKDKKVRIDYIQKNGKLQKYKIIDFGKGEYKVVNPDKKLYVQSFITITKYPEHKNLEISKTGNYKTINDKVCFQWIVKDKSQNSVVTYWVYDIGYKYFSNILEVLDETEKISLYFIHIPDTGGYVPLLSEERSYLREERMKMSSQKIMKVSVDDNIFEVPKGYVLFN